MTAPTVRPTVNHSSVEARHASPLRCAGKPFAVGLYRNHHRSQADFLASELLTSAIDSTVDRHFIKNNYLPLLQTSLLSCLRRALAPNAIDRFITGFCQFHQPTKIQPRPPYRLKIDRIYVLLLSLKKTWGILDLYCGSPADWVAKARATNTGGYQRGRLLLLRNQPINKSMNTNQEVLCNF
jgi:hypothetical protein